jgi:hypothetical protein
MARILSGKSESILVPSHLFVGVRRFGEVGRESNDLTVLLSGMLRFHKAVHQLSAIVLFQKRSHFKSFQLLSMRYAETTESAPCSLLVGRTMISTS